jgi:multidrug efflux pump subunit AcrA (membrane-fusion protein)
MKGKHFETLPSTSGHCLLYNDELPASRNQDVSPPGCLRPPVIVKIDSSLVVFIPTVKLPQAQIAGAEVIVNNIENNSQTVFVSRSDEFFEGRWTPVLAFNGKNQSGIISPGETSPKLHGRHHLNGIDPEFSQVGKLFDGFIKISRQNSRRVIKSADNYSVGAVVTLNIFSGDRTSAKVREAKAALRQIQALRRKLKQRVLVETRQAYLQADSAWRRIHVARAAVAQAEEALRIVRNRYKNGLFTIVDLLNAELALQQAHTNHLRAIHDYKVSTANLMLAAARSRVQQFQAAVSAADVASDDAVILAPYDGIVTAKMSDVGDLATPGTPFLTLEGTGGFTVDVVLPEAYFNAVRLNQTVMIRIPSLGDRTLEGIVGTIVPVADQSSRSFLVKTRLPADAAVRSGMFARVVVKTGEERIMLIPASAVVPQGQLTGIFIVDDRKLFWYCRLFSLLALITLICIERFTVIP